MYLKREVNTDAHSAKRKFVRSGNQEASMVSV